MVAPRFGSCADPGRAPSCSVIGYNAIGISGNGATAVTKLDLQRLAEMRIREAGILLAAGEFDGAYYLAGYAVEFALKVCVLVRLSDLWHGDKKQATEFATRCYTHDLADLLKLAELESD